VWVLSAVGVVVVFGLLDLARPADDRTHLGRLFERIGDDGWSAFETVVVRKLQANLSVLTSSVWTLMVPLALAVAAYLLWVAPGRLRRLRDEPALRTALPGLGVAGVLGFALNDSGIAVPGMMLGVVGASLAYLLVRTT
jgi:NAD/NADP transhydrogenase beta subunit